MSLADKIKALGFVSVPDLTKAQQFELLDIRNQQIIRESSYSSHVIAEDEHLNWVERLDRDATVLFYAVFLGGQIVGGVGLRKIDLAEGVADWSFYVSESAHGQGIGLAMGVCALDLFFEELKLKTITGEALVSNPASLSYHEKLGFAEFERSKHRVQPGNELADIVVYKLPLERWLRQRQVLLGS